MSQRAPHILVAGIGNIFLGDDAFGSEVARRLMARRQPPGVRVVDFGIRSLDLVYALLEGPDAAILIDAVPRPEPEPPGTLFVLEPCVDPAPTASPMIDGHSMDPATVLRAAAAMGARPGRVLIVGCQPAVIPADDEGETPLGMSEPVCAAVEGAIGLVESLVRSLIESPVLPMAQAHTDPEPPRHEQCNS